MELAANISAEQQPVWPDPEELQGVRKELAVRGELASPSDTIALQAELAKAATGEGFVIQAGPCAEPLNISASAVTAIAHTVAQMGTTIESLAGFGTVPIFRLAGQFCKPRSNETETRGGITLPSFRGQLVNDHEFTEDARRPDPQRMLSAFDSARSTRELLGALVNSNVFTAHEALLLDYELPQVKALADDAVMSTSANFLWIGDRTRGITGAHIALCENITNPIGVKLGPSTTPEDAMELCERLNPAQVPGRLTLIPRFGAASIQGALPPIIERVKRQHPTTLWIVDPMHGNTKPVASGQKTRHIEDILSETEQFFAICERHNVRPAGVHLELSGQEVTECLGAGVTQLDGRYETLCDPRVNRGQAELIAERIGGLLAKL